MKDFGDFLVIENAEEYLLIGFSPTSLPLKERWRNFGLSADFLADYWSTFLPGDADGANRNLAEIKGSISYIANELLENAMKFANPDAPSQVSIQLFLYKDQMRFYIRNGISDVEAAKFQNLIESYIHGDIGQLYMERIELNAKNPVGGQSGLGLLTIMNDYDTRLAWRFDDDPKNPGALQVTTMVVLSFE